MPRRRLAAAAAAALIAIAAGVVLIARGGDERGGADGRAGARTTAPPAVGPLTADAPLPLVTRPNSLAFSGSTLAVLSRAPVTSRSSTRRQAYRAGV